jgi:SagB-type dehydrogenase family enzyme
VREAHEASSFASADEVRAWRAAEAVPPSAIVGERLAIAPLDGGAVPEPIEAVILRRGSTRRFPHAPIPLDHLATIVQAGTRPAPLDVSVVPDLYLIAHAVDGLPSGSYACDPDGRHLLTLQAGDFRREAERLDLGQELAGDAAANIYWLDDLEPVFARLGDRGYRTAALAAGIAGGRAYLAAYALGLGATGLTFFDDDVTTFFSPHAAGKSVLFLVAVGRRGRAR